MKRVLLKSFGVLLESLPLRRGEGLKNLWPTTILSIVFYDDDETLEDTSYLPSSFKLESRLGLNEFL